MAEIGESARSLGVRPGVDVPARAPDEIVLPGVGGMSVSPEDPANLPPFRRPPEFGGVGRDPVWALMADELGPDLRYRPDPANPAHGFVEPARPMPLKAYQDALTQTQARWRQAEPGTKERSDADED
jgi:hypothetical protein